MSGPIRITTKGEVIAAVPRAARFLPTESVVVLLLTGPRVYAVIRVDAVPQADPSTLVVVAGERDRSTGLRIARFGSPFRLAPRFVAVDCAAGRSAIQVG